MSLTRKLIEILEGRKYFNNIELSKLIELAGRNKILLGFLRRIDDSSILRLNEETKYHRYISLLKEIVRQFNGLNYALYKFRKPVEHVSVDIDILIDSGDVVEASKRLLRNGFKLVVIEPYTVTFQKYNIPIDLYTQPAFAWIIYMDGDRLLECCVEEIDIDGIEAKALTRDAEVVSVAAHAIYKEHMYLLADYFTVKEWISKKVIELAREHNVEDSISIALKLNNILEDGLADAPLKIDLSMVTKLYASKFLRDDFFRASSINILKYLGRGDIGERFLNRLTRSSY